MDVGTVRQVDIDAEMRAAYLDYAMSVIVSRALPDARDGLKPVHRRILYAMFDMGLRAATPYRKSARIVGEVLGKYHPHGDSAVYESMVRMAQDFAMRYPLVDGQGNFGSIDGDAAAAMRYTEARMQAVAEAMLNDIEKQTVEFVDNFDGSLVEPSVLPANIPNLLINGSSGIAVGMSTSIPPHNITEVCEALAYMLDHWENLDDVTVGHLLNFIKGPDFPTGGLIFRYSEGEEADSLAQAYATGRGKLTVQARAHVEDTTRGRSRIIVTEMPFQVNKTNLIERIAELAREGRIEGITDLRDESDRQGIRIVIELARTVEPGAVLQQLYKLTPMRTTFSVIMLALVDGEPRLLTLKQALRVYLEHRLEIIERRSRFDLERARERAHILEGLLVALDNLDEIIALIRRSRTVETARDNLQKRFSLSQAQAQAILDMQLRRLAALERKKIEDEYKDKIKAIRFLEKLLESPRMMRDVIKEELADLRQAYADPRRTYIVDGKATSATSTVQFLVEEQVWVTLTASGLLSRTFDDEQPKITTAIKDAPRTLLQASTGDTLYLFAGSGLAATVPVHQLDRQADFQAGTHFSNLSPLGAEQDIVAALALPPAFNTGYLTMATLEGQVKRVALEDVPGLSANSFPAILLSGDALGWLEWTPGGAELLLFSAEGKAIRFSEEDIRPMGLRAGSVKGIKLGSKDDQAVGLNLYPAKGHIWSITQQGTAKSSPAGEYPLQGRYGQGVIAMKVSAGDALAATAVGALDAPVIIVTTKGKPKLVRLGSAPRVGRAGAGEQVIALGGSERIAYVLVPRSRNIGESG